jgi:hypothetical protein
MFYVVRGLSPYTEYEFHVIGVNNIGRGQPSSPVSVITGETGECQSISFSSSSSNTKNFYFNIPIAYICSPCNIKL